MQPRGRRFNARAAIGGAYARLAAVAHDRRLLSEWGSGERSMTEGMTRWLTGTPWPTAWVSCPGPCRILGSCSRPCSGSSTPPGRCSRWTGRVWRWTMRTARCAGWWSPTEPPGCWRMPSVTLGRDPAGRLRRRGGRGGPRPGHRPAFRPAGHGGNPTRVRGVLAVPVAVAGRPVGALSVYAPERCPWSGIDVAAVGAYAGVVAELQAGQQLDQRRLRRRSRRRWRPSHRPGDAH